MENTEISEPLADASEEVETPEEPREITAPVKEIPVEAIPADAIPVEVSAVEAIPVQELLPETEALVDHTDAEIRAILEAIIYITDEPLTLEQMAAALHQPRERVASCLAEISAEFAKPEHGLSIQEVAGGYKMSTKAEHHERVRAFVKNLKPPLKLSLPALETLAVIAYRQPITAPEIMEVRGVQGAGVLKTLLDRKLIATGGRKNVVGKPILYKTTREFLVQFGLKDLGELPSLKEFEELGRMSIADDALAENAPAPLQQPATPQEDAAE